MRVYEYGNLIPAILVNRKNRFVAEVLFKESSDPVECYMANPGSMLGMCVKGSEVRLSASSKVSRRLKHTVEAIKIRDTWIGCNTHIANEIVSEILRDRSLAMTMGFPEYNSYRREVQQGKSRFDFKLTGPFGPAFIEVKTVTMASDWFEIESLYERADRKLNTLPDESPAECFSSCSAGKHALFPDCKSQRARKHVEELGMISRQSPAILVYVVMRDDVESVGPSRFCDVDYSDAVALAVASGLQITGFKIKYNLEDPNDGYLTIGGTLRADSPPEPGLPRSEKRRKFSK
jgi:sugar fermentation stimulation protein A